MSMDTSVPLEDKNKVFAPWVWTPLLITLVGFCPVMAHGILCRSLLMILIGITLYLIGLAYFLVQTIGRLFLRQWPSALYALGRLLLSMVPGLLLWFVISSVSNAFNSPEDEFAKDLIIPTDIEVADPLSQPLERQNREACLQRALLDAWRMEPTNDPCVVPALPSLESLASEHLPTLRQYLVFNPAWRVSETDGTLCATRRLKFGKRWKISSGEGLYKDPVFNPKQELIYFKFRMTILLGDEPLNTDSDNITRLDEGTSAQPIRLKERASPWGTPRSQTKWFKSHAVVSCGPVTVKLLEESEGAERKLTKAALQELESECRVLLDRINLGQSLWPTDSMRHGKPILNLYDNFFNEDWGNYQSEVWINPGEPGSIYLKAFEVTQGTHLSEPLLRKDSTERIGWSSDPNELFYSHATFTIHEGDSGDPYAARFEVWFVPDSGQPERKLLDRVFKIEGS